MKSILQLGFRPFYLLAGLAAIAGICLWLLSFTGQLQFGNYLTGVLWHSHEMVFGFAAAVMAGFLFTAVRNWTGLPTPTGPVLGLIALLWIAARFFVVTGPHPFAVGTDVAFLLVVTCAIAVPIFRSKNQRNYKVVAILLAISLLHAVFHLAIAGKLPAWLARTSLFTVIDLVVILFAIVGGRVIPAFTRNAVSGSNPHHEVWLEFVSFTSLVLVALVTLFSGVFTLASSVMLVLFLVAAVAQWLRLTLWQPHLTLNNPLLWMMPVAYAWLPVALLLRGLATTAVLVPSTWIHALTMGAISSLMMAMMMRSTLGHTGRPLAASRTDMAAFLLLQLAALLRIFAGTTGYYREMILLSGVTWALAFGVFLLRYVPMLTRPRADGRPG